MPSDDLTIFKMKGAAAISARERFKQLIEEIKNYNEMYFNFNTLYEVIRSYFVDEDIIASWLEFLTHKELNNETLTKEEVFNFIAEANMQYAKKFTMLDATSALLEMGAGEEKDRLNWFTKLPEALVANFELKGTYGCIYGPPRIGKTSLAVNFMKIFADMGIHTITNIKILDPPQTISYVTKMSDFLRVVIEKNKWIAILDETAVYVPKQKAVSQRNIDFVNLARFVGKLGGRMLLITHNFEMDVPTPIQAWTTEKYFKKELKLMWVDLTRQDGKIKMHKYIDNIPDAKEFAGYEFITQDLAGLHFDVDVDKLLQYIPDAGYENQKRAIKEFLDKKGKINNQVNEIIGEVLKDADEFKNTQGKFSPEIIQTKLGCPRRIARVVAHELNKKMKHENK